MLDAIEQYDSEIERIAKQHADYDIFNSLPGTGSALTPRAIALSKIPLPMLRKITHLI